jgi:hypothetical protein
MTSHKFSPRLGPASVVVVIESQRTAKAGCMPALLIIMVPAI